MHMRRRSPLLLITVACCGAACLASSSAGEGVRPVGLAAHSRGTSENVGGRGGIGVIDFRPTDGAIVASGKVAALRVIELFSRDDGLSDVPKIGYSEGMLARGVLGAVPLEEDGSVRFEVPSGVELYVQALDVRGRALFTVGPSLRLRAGETRIIVGSRCLARGTEPAGAASTLACRKPPVRLEPESQGSYPLSFARLVQPVLDRHCIGCHDGRSGRPDLRPDLFEAGDGEEIPPRERLCGVESLHGGWSRSYADLKRHAWSSVGSGGAGEPGEANPTDGEAGARASRLVQMLDCGHGNCNLSADDSHRIALWLDCDSPFYGAYHDACDQARGGLVRPRAGYLTEFEN